MKEDRSIDSIRIRAIRVFSENNQVFKQEGTGDWQVIPFEWTSVIYKYAILKHKYHEINEYQLDLESKKQYQY